MRIPKHPESFIARLRLARERFRELLRLNAAESEWQALFAEHPYVLSRSLPLRLSPSEIVPLGRPGQSEADFIFYQRSQALITGYGVIELKRPDSRVLTSPRKDIVILTREADTAIRQASQYAQALRFPQRALFLGASQHLFVIMGLSAQLTKAIGSELLRNQASELVPTGCQILPYDELLRRFESSIPDRVLVLVPLMPRSNAATAPTIEGLPEGLSSLLHSIGDSSAYLEQLVDYATRRTRELAHRLGDATVDTEGISQEALLCLLQNSSNVSNERGWLDAVIHRLLLQTQRASPLSRVPFEVLTEGEAGGGDTNLAIFTNFERQQRAQDLWDAVDRLPFDLMQVVLLVVRGFEVREIAQHLNLTHAAAQRRYKQAIVQLSALLRGAAR